MTDILLVGATGAMGREVAKAAADFNCSITAGVGVGECDFEFPLYEDFSNIKESFDCIIDFSNSSVTPMLLDYLEKCRKPAFIATTGLSDELKERVKKTGETSAVVLSGNASLGINIMQDMVRQMTEMLSGFDIEIIEKHHNKKVDAPSGTAEMLFQSVKDARPDAVEVNDRSTVRQQRDENEVGVVSIRGGTVVGEHSVLFLGLDEVLEIKHSAGSKKIFVTGAYKAVDFLVGKDTGYYEMGDVLHG